MGKVLCVVAYLSFLLVALGSGHNRKRYDEYQVIDIQVTNRDQLKHVAQLKATTQLDFLGERSVLASPEMAVWLKDYLHQHTVPYQVTQEDVQTLLDAEWARLDARYTGDEENFFDLDDFNIFDDILAELDEMAARCPADLTCDTYSIGDSYEGRPLKVLRIRKEVEASTRDDINERPGFWIDSNIHGGEWIASSTLLKIADHISRDYETDEEVRELVDKYDWYILPMMNPDGYEYAWNEERFWRKNRRPSEGSECFGVDLNRNYDHMWGNAGTSPDPCSNSFRGPSPASEVETQIVAVEAERLAQKLRAWISIHTTGNMWMHPFGFLDDPEDPDSCAIAEDHDDLYRFAGAAANATMAVFNTTWTFGNICQTIYAAAGSSLDYVYAKSPVLKYAFGPELRGPSAQVSIIPSYQEVWPGLVAIVREIDAIEGTKKK